MDIGSLPTVVGVEDAAGFVERLNQLRVWAGRPSFRRLTALGGTTTTPDRDVVDLLPRSTLSDVLTGKRLPELPRMELVGAFVAACLTACALPPDVIDTVVEQWLAEWRRLSQQVCAGTGGAAVGDRGEADQPRAGADDWADDWIERSLRYERPLVGRRPALRTFRNALDEAAGGKAQFVAVTGEPGAGKTRLLRELGTVAARQGLMTLWGRAGEFEQGMPFGVLIDALDDRLEGRETWVHERLGAAATRLLTGVFPSISAASADETVDWPEVTALTRYRTYRAIR
ncbi:BREX system ATP-binding domain-containing protein, partial [Nonomuraea sp. M3C6]